MKDKTIALAALCQALYQVQQMANYGQSQSSALQPCIESLFRMDAETAEDVYDGIANLHPGLRILSQQLDGDERDTGLTRMAASVLQLERSFIRSGHTIESIQQGLDRIQAERDSGVSNEATVLSHLGDLYAEHISPLGTRVLVQGNPIYLSRPDVIGEVRATLLAALRAAVLWRQMGGSYWDFLFSRQKISDCARALRTSGA